MMRAAGIHRTGGDEALGVGPGDRLLVNGAGGMTGRLPVCLGALRGAEVIATAGPRSRASECQHERFDHVCPVQGGER
jgi:NADPH:quinone reductase-like Zn-dependent oxidoreductase